MYSKRENQWIAKRIKLNWLRTIEKKLKSINFFRTYTDYFKLKCAISVISIAFAKIIGICSQSHNADTMAKTEKQMKIRKNKSEQSKYEIISYNYTIR